MVVNFTKGQYKWIVYSSYTTVISSALWAGMNIINQGFGGTGTFIPLTAGVVFFFYGQYFERKMNKTER